jgi:hypothetical protein
VGAGVVESDGGGAGSEGFDERESVTLVAGGEQIEVCGLEERRLAFARQITGETDLGVPKPGSERAEPGGVPVALHEGGFAADEQPEWLGQQVLTLTLEESFEQQVVSFLGRETAETNEDAGSGWNRKFPFDPPPRIRNRPHGHGPPVQHFDPVLRRGRVASKQDVPHWGRWHNDAGRVDKTGALLFEDEPEYCGRQGGEERAEPFPQAGQDRGGDFVSEVDASDVGDHVDVIEGYDVEPGAGEAGEVGSFREVIDENGGAARVMAERFARRRLVKSGAESGVLTLVQADEFTGGGRCGAEDGGAEDLEFEGPGASPFGFEKVGDSGAAAEGHRLAGETAMGGEVEDPTNARSH